ncbi:ATP-dependent RNA helicase HrpA [Caballeronia sp. dw_19]|uniref:ATP-dependent RNA helicase HrpA n=1 Tax=Caballeronia sp. dw_19 TaxID=2719791 RepID=UPI0021039F66|nr:ATP-dependent RNA helicase HrpA [Caballeronia sp. dw_19]
MKKLREALLRDAAARESDGEDDAGGGTGTAANSKKDAAARRFSGVSGAGSTGGSAKGSAVGQQASKKSVQKGAGVSSASRDESKGSSGGASSLSSSSSRQGSPRKDERGGAVSLSSLSALASLSLSSGKVSGPGSQAPVAEPERRRESASVRVGSEERALAIKRTEAPKTPSTPIAPHDERVFANSPGNRSAGSVGASVASTGVSNVPRSERVSRVGPGQPGKQATVMPPRREPETKAQTAAASGSTKNQSERSASDTRPERDSRKAHVSQPADASIQQRVASEPSAQDSNIRRTQESRIVERTDTVQPPVSSEGHAANRQRDQKPGKERGNTGGPSTASEARSDRGASSGLPVDKQRAHGPERTAAEGAPQRPAIQPRRSDAQTRSRAEPGANNARQQNDGRTSENAQQGARSESGAAQPVVRSPSAAARPVARSQHDAAAQPAARHQPDDALGRAVRPQPDSSRPNPRPQHRDTPRPRRVVEPNPIPPIRFPETLPVSARRDEIAAAIQANQVVIVSGETGSGKTTQLPKICLALGRGLGAGGTGLIGHTQPRRIAASATGRRIAEELGTPFGEVVGYKVRFTDNLSPGASVKLMTDGILLAETQTDPLLAAYDTIIIDEAHERSLNIDFLLGYLREILPRRPDLKVIVTSATIDADRFARHFGSDEKPAPVIEVSGRLYPVEVRYRPVEEESAAVKSAQGPTPGTQPKDRPDRPKTQRENDRDLMEAIVDAVDELCREGPGDVLVFLPGEREIRDAAEALRKHHPPHTEILPLFARLSAAEQERVFRTSNTRRIVLATNVAETSLTVPGIRYVVDTGLARVKRYSYRNKVEQLQIEPISQSSANQRAGRCGRVADGVCIRLYEEDDYNLRVRFTDPEILRSSLAAVILRMKSLHLTAIETFPFLEPPPGRAIADGYQLLNELGAVDDDNALTPLGRELARLPLDPRVGRMILAARDHQSLREVLIIASALSVQDPRDRPIEAQEQADLAHKKFADERSEFLQWTKIWAWFEDAIAHKKSNKQLTDACRANFLNHVRLREWRDVHSQLLTVVREHGWRLNESEATFEQIHLALLTGLLGNVGLKADDEPYYLGARGIKFYLWPGSALLKKAGRWVVAGELVETSRLYARCIAKIEPEWLEQVGAHLLRKSISEPHWEKKAAQVAAFERATLHGLTVYARRRVSFGKQDPERARELFIRGALVDGEFETKLPFFAHNRKLLADIEQLEHKSRRQDVLVDDELIFGFYDSLVPKGMYSGAAFERWYRDEEKKNGASSRLLFLSRDDLMRHEAAGVTTDLFPKRMTMAGIEMTLTYHFEPGSARDGVTLTVPLFGLNQVDARRSEWLVRGMLKEKVQLLLKSLPQKLRRHLVPLPEFSAGVVERHSGKTFGAGGLLEALIADIREQTQIAMKPSDFKLESLPAHLFMNFKVIDEHGRQLAMGRNLAQLRSELGGQAQQHFQKLAAGATLDGSNDTAAPVTRTASASDSSSTALYENLTTWDFGKLPELLEIRRRGQTLFGYPALVDRGTHCDVEVFDSPEEAARIHRAGLRRLFALQLREPIRYLERNLGGLREMSLHYMALGTQEELAGQIIETALDRACLQDPLPDNDADFYARRDQGKSRLTLLAQEIARLAGQILAEYATISKKLTQAKSFGAPYSDMIAQLSALIGKRFIIDTPYTQLSHFPRYLTAIGLRIDKLKADAVRDARLSAEIAPLLQNYPRAIAQRGGVADARLSEYRWLLEELRVSLFAQELRTPMPISVKRLYKVWESMQR